MGLKKLPLAEATDANIREFLVGLGVEGVETASDAALHTMLKSVWDLEHIMVQDAGEASGQTDRAATPPGQVLPKSVAYNDDPIVELTIGTSPGIGGNQPVPVAVNGVTVVLQRNTLIQCPYRFYLALKNATRGIVDDKGGVMDHQAYPFQVTGLPSKDEVDAWFERTKDLVAA